MKKALHQKIFLFAAKAGALEGYLFQRKEVEPLDNWVENISKMYQELPAEVKEEINPALSTVINRALEYGKSVLKPEIRGKLEQLL